MPGLKLMCPICTDGFQETDEIYTTSCGHLYHLSCMQQWKSRSPSCPQCRHHNPTTHKLYLILNEDDEPSAPTEDAEDLRTKLESSVDKIHELEAQLQEIELNFLHMQEQYTNEFEQRRRFEHQIAEFNNNEENFLHLHAQYSESEDRAKLLQEENERLSLENEYKSEEIVLKSNEISVLKETLKGVRCEKSRQNESEIINLHAQYSESEDRLKNLQQEIKRLTLDSEYKTKELALKAREIAALKELQNGKCESSADIIANTKLNTLEQKLKHITGELKKEIENSSQLQIDKIKLQCQIQRMKLQVDPTKDTNEKNEHTHSRRLLMENNPNLANIRHELPLPSFSTTLNKSKEEQTEESSRSIVLQKFPYKEISYPLEDVIVLIAAKMEVPLTKDDIIKVNVMDKIMSKKIPRDVCVQVEFKTMDLKTQFLTKKSLLRKDDKFQLVNVKNYVDRQIHGVFLYANRLLRGVLFDDIVCWNSTIIAKKNRQDTEGLIIYSKQQVDDLLSKSTLPANTPSPPDEVIDECYYRI